ncbi:Cys-tRNA(Pro) deacylase [Kocuria tytonis]|uniref:Cys-tRNA(Pro)/Cys-tRNA(Cys) deacylase n=1 Tax=Kocuria tytonis TaxID=2054280 RepID=A0A495AAP0_9MICC|nr:Cys-tRNA(Pro) deacylase [Kocuria tytonis]RKQ36510.1 Cys-tRNA(Pro) deacylase [Kocuria tytonis]
MTTRKQKSSATPATRALSEAGVPFRELSYEHDPRAESYGNEAAEALGLAPEAVFKTLVVSLDHGGFGVCVVPVAARADLKAVAAALGAKKAHLADPADVHRLTGYVLGGVSPLGQRSTLPTVVDESARSLAELYVSGGRRGFDVGLRPEDLVRVTGAVVAAVAQGGA